MAFEPQRDDWGKTHDLTSPGGASAEGRRPAGLHGDAAGEHLRMEHGRYGAWIYVVLAFLGEWAVAAFLVALLLEPLGRHLAESVPALVAGAAGLGLAVWTFWDRWRVNEAFCSRYCSGLVNLTLLYLPVVSFFYANYRAVRKLRGS